MGMFSEQNDVKCLTRITVVITAHCVEASVSNRDILICYKPKKVHCKYCRVIVYAVAISITFGANIRSGSGLGYH